MEGKDDCETDQFFKRFVQDRSFLDDISEIKRLILNMGRFGAHQQRFRFEDNAHALPDSPNKLRLYCIRCTEGTVILCGGGQKTSQKVQDSPDAYPHFKLAKQIETLFRERVQDGDIRYNGKFLDGDLYFDTDLI